VDVTETAGGGRFDRIAGALAGIQASLREAGLDGWLLYDLHARNAVASALLGQGDLSRRYFVLIPADGEPTAIVHGIEVAPWDGWPWQRRVYAHWSELAESLGSVLGGAGTIAMEYSELDAVPALDLVPAGVVELVRAQGARVVSSGDLVTRFYSRWSAADLATHTRASHVLAGVAADTFVWLAGQVEAGHEPTEGAMHAHVLRLMAERGVGVGADCIAATGLSAADPHYHPDGGGATFGRGDLVLLDLWGKESEVGIYADQTWMAYLGNEVPTRAAALFAALRDGRDAAVRFLEDAWAEGREITGGMVDDVTRGVLRDRDLDRWFIHRTGHSIDRATHGAGPNIDNHETREVRRLIPGIGFSIEPGIYIANEIGLRSEINVYIGEDGPVVTTPNPQREIAVLLRG
jgi:Xaa-Pro dipeptidase